jgi:hypothetical protein
MTFAAACEELLRVLLRRRATSSVMLNLFQHPFRAARQVEAWTLKQVQGDGREWRLSPCALYDADAVDAQRLQHGVDDRVGVQARVLILLVGLVLVLEISAAACAQLQAGIDQALVAGERQDVRARSRRPRLPRS